ncbi:MAG TPA: circadian clock protein KaiC [Terriglobia bacterium]|nr:circadian clock protein KaiC [Terriglobia bacterium]
MERTKVAKPLEGLSKCPTGVRGLDEITFGGLPAARPTLVCGAAGCGKTVLATEFLVRGAVQYGEPGVFMAFEETAEELARNAASLGFDFRGLEARKKLLIEHVRVERNEIEETGEYNLEGLFIRLGHAIDSIGAKRVVLDTVEALFSGLANHAVVRSELRRLFGWLKEKGVTAIITAEKGDGTLTRHGLEEYVADCVMVLDHRVNGQIATRRLRIVKYRGSLHGTNEFPFLINNEGFSVLPITSIGLDYQVPSARLSSGVPKLDAMLGGRGYFRASHILVSGSAGTGKTSLAGAFTLAACARGERCLYFAFEESPSQIMRNLRSIGIDVEGWVKKGLLRFCASRPTGQSLESHLVEIYHHIDAFRPRVIVMDPITNFTVIGNPDEIKSMMSRLLDHVKSRQITVLCTSLTSAGEHEQESEVGISSLVDTWILLRNLEAGGERNRGLYILKSRGMAHSNQIREFVLSNKGIELVEPYIGLGTVLTGSARVAQEARERAERLSGKQEADHERAVAEARVAALRAELMGCEENLNRLNGDSALRIKTQTKTRAEMTRLRDDGAIGA